MAPVEDVAAWSNDEGDDEDDASEDAVGKDDALHDGGDSDDAGAEERVAGVASAAQGAGRDDGAN